MRKLLIIFLLFFPILISADQTVTLSWQAPTTNEDGTPLTDLAGFKIYCKTIGDYILRGTINNPAQLDYILTITSDAVCIATAFDVSGNESTYSNSVEFMPPSACTGLRKK